MKVTEDRAYRIGFILLLLLSAFFTLPYHRGFITGDCAQYLEAAYNMTHGHWQIDGNYYANRVGTFLPYVPFIYFFGIGKWLTWVTTGEFLCILVMVYMVVKKYDKAVAFTAACFLGLSILLQVNAALLMGDIAAVLTSNSVVICFFIFIFYVDEKGRLAKRWGVFTALLFVAAFLTKESVVFYLPLLLYLSWVYRGKPEMKTYWSSAFITLVVSGMIIVLAYYIKTGDPLYRIRALNAGPSASDVNYLQASWLQILARVSWQPFQFIVENFTYGSLFFFGLLQMVTCGKDRPAQERFFNVFFIGSLIMWWAGSQGLTSYNPVGLVDRIWMPLVVPMAINSAFFLVRVIQDDLSVRARRVVTYTTILFLLCSYTALFFLCRTLSSLGVDIPATVPYNVVCFTTFSIAVLLSIHTGTIISILPPVRLLLFMIVMFLSLEGCLQACRWYMTNQMAHVRDEYDYDREMVLYAAGLKPRRLICDAWVWYSYNIYTYFETTLPVVKYNDIDTAGDGDYLLLIKKTQAILMTHVAETTRFTNIASKFKVSDVAIHPEAYGFVLIKENDASLLYRHEGHRSDIKLP